MPKIASKKTQRYRIIKDAVDLGLSGSKIQEILRENDLGMRNKALYAEIRAIKGKTISKEKSFKSIPKKYRKGRKKGISKGSEVDFGKVGQIYRGSLIISSVPLHSKPFDRHYLGFRLNVFSFSKSDVYSALRNMKRMFLQKVGDKVKSYQYAVEQTMGIENPKRINVSNPERLNNKWFFAVEEKGRDIGSDSGYI